MTEWIVTSSALILIVIALRGLLKGKISLRLQYGLWALVLVRLLIPFSIADSAISIANILSVPTITEADNALEDYKDSIDTIRNDYNQRGETVTNEELREQALEALRDKAQTKLEQEYEQSGTQIQTPEIREEIRQQAQQQVAAISFTAMVTDALPYLWLAGVALVGEVLIGSNLHFGWKLRRSRKELDLPHVPGKVYLTDYVATPCLFGIGKPDIYLTNEVMEDSRMRSHVLAHEMSHYRQGDHIWSVLRCVCLVLHWYNPLVWVAAILSKQDAELACDEATIRNLGEEERVAYGRTLIGMTCVRRDPRSLMLTATTMLGTKKTLKERVLLIAKKPQMALYTLVACILVAAIAVGCTFTGVPEKSEQQLLLDRCREALENIQSQEYFDLISENESTDPDAMLINDIGRFIHSGEDYYHSRVTADWIWEYLKKDGQWYRRDETNRDVIITGYGGQPEWQNGYFEDEFYAMHCWLMELTWDDDGITQTNSYTGESFEFKIRSASKEKDIDNGWDVIRVETEILGQESVDSYVFAFRFAPSGELDSVSRVIYEGDYVTTNTLTIVTTHPKVVQAYIDAFYSEVTGESTEPKDPGDAKLSITNIRNRAIEENLAVPSALELFYTDAGIKYYFPGVISPYIIVTYNDGSSEDIVSALNAGRATIADLDKFGIKYISGPSIEVAEFQDLFTSEEGYWYWRAMGCIFENPDELNLEYLFYNGLKSEDRDSQNSDPTGLNPFTDSEVAFLSDYALEKFGDETVWVNARKLPREAVNDVLVTYFGVSLDTVSIPENWAFYEETDSYYCIRFDGYGVDNSEVVDVQYEENGIVHVYWATTDWIMDTRSDPEAWLIPLENNVNVMLTTLQQKDDGSYMVLSNTPYATEDPVPHITRIQDRTREENLPVAQSLELFFMDAENSYYFPGVMSQYIIVHYSDGTTENIITALQTERATIADLDTYGIRYIKNPRE